MEGSQPMQAEEMDIDIDGDETGFETAAMVQDDTEPMVEAHQVDPSMRPAIYDEDVDDCIPIAEKVNVECNSKDFGADDPQNYAIEHFPSPAPEIQWLNDYSFNLVYKDATIAAHALEALTATEDEDSAMVPAQTQRQAKPYSVYPHVSILVRQANTDDKKVRGAHKKSEYYKSVGDRAPRERRRSYTKRYVDQDAVQQGTNFDESMYDDAPSRDRPRPERRRSSFDADRRSRYQRSDRDNRGRDYDNQRRDKDRYVPQSRRNGRSDLEEREYGRLRDRSASPMSEGDGRLGFDEGGSSLRRDYGGRDHRQPRRDRDTRENAWVHDRYASPDEDQARSASKSKGGLSWNDFKAGQYKPGQGAERFPNKTEVSNHRRTDATDETANTGVRSLASRMSKIDEPVPLKYRITRTETPTSDIEASDRESSGFNPFQPSARSRTSRRQPDTSYGRLKDDFSAPAPNDFELSADEGRGSRSLSNRLSPADGIQIRGRAAQQPVGFQIRGAARDA